MATDEKSEQKSEQDLQAQLNALRTDLAEITKTVRNISADYAHQGQDRLRDTAQRAQQQFKDSLGTVQEEIEHRPFSSVAVAFGIGLIIGRLLHRH